MLDPRQQIKRLEAVNSERLEKIVVRRELFPRHLEMRSRKLENFVESGGRRRRRNKRDVPRVSNHQIKIKASPGAHPRLPQTSVALVRPPDGNKGRRKYQFPASVPHTVLASQTPWQSPQSVFQILPPGWRLRGLLATLRLRRPSDSRDPSAAPSSH